MDLKTKRRLVIDLAGANHQLCFSPDGQLLAATGESFGLARNVGPAVGIYLFDVGTP